MYLHKELMSSKPRFIAMDVMCKYWPYLHKSANILPDLQELTSIKPFLSVMHATAHSTKCEVCSVFIMFNCIKSLCCASGSCSPCRYLLSDNDRRTLHYPLHVFLLLDYMEWQKPRRSRVNCGGGS